MAFHVLLELRCADLEAVKHRLAEIPVDATGQMRHRQLQKAVSLARVVPLRAGRELDTERVLFGPPVRKPGRM
jgi:hypothetical protein